jgi:hypothetical protein
MQPPQNGTSQPLDAIRRPRDTPPGKLEASPKCGRVGALINLINQKRPESLSPRRRDRAVRTWVD